MAPLDVDPTLRAVSALAHRRVIESVVGLRAKDVLLTAASSAGPVLVYWKEAGLATITPHECRHTYASLMLAAGVNIHALSTYMGHSSIRITLDRYGHLLPGSHEAMAAQFDQYLQESGDARARKVGAEALPEGQPA